MFPPIESPLIRWLNGSTGVRATAELENNFTPPANHVESLGATNDGFRLAFYTVDIDSYAGTRPDAEQLAADTMSAVYAAHNAVISDSVVVSSVDTVSGPRWIATDRSDVRRFSATYQIGVHYA